MRPHFRWLAVFGTVVCITGSAQAAGESASQADRYKNLELFQKVLHFVENNYVEEVKNDELIQGAIKGMLETLDPHSNFLSQEVFRDMKIDTSGKFGGIGIEITQRDGILLVVAPIEDTPAWKAGLKPDDMITKINGESTKGLTLTEAVAKMRGKRGSPVTLNIFRKGWDKPREYSIQRETIKIRSVKWDELGDGYGYVRLSSFNESAAVDVRAAIEKLEKNVPGKKLKGLIFDLRTNPGGLLDQAVDVASLFIDEGVVVSTLGRNKNQKEVKYAKPGMARKELPLAILVNGSTASASEIVAGALQDHHRAIILGSTTFGKGSVQTVIELGNDMGLKLTIARYYTPNGRSIQEKGVVPDVALEEYDSKLLEKARTKRDTMREKDLKGHIVNSDEAKARPEFTPEELESMGKAAKKRDKDDEADDAPIRFNAKEDYQVREAVNYLKSFDVFRKLDSKALSKPGLPVPGSGNE